MNTNILPFWEMKVNAITMQEKDITLRNPVQKESKPRRRLDDDLMIFSDCREYLGIGARKIKAYSLRLGEKSIDSKIGVMYKKSTIEKIKAMLQAEEQNKLKSKRCPKTD